MNAGPPKLMNNNNPGPGVGGVKKPMPPIPGNYLYFNVFSNFERHPEQNSQLIAL